MPEMMELDRELLLPAWEAFLGDSQKVAVHVFSCIVYAEANSDLLLLEFVTASLLS